MNDCQFVMKNVYNQILPFLNKIAQENVLFSATTADNFYEYWRQHCYDASLLQREDKLVQRVFREASSNLLETSCLNAELKGTLPRPNTILATCITNYYKEKKSYRKVSGLGLLVRLRDNIRDIYLLADAAHTLEGCADSKYSIQQFLQDVLNTTSKFTDIYLEYTSNPVMERQKIDSYLKRVTAHFVNCSLGRFNRTDVCPVNTRIHYTDIRTGQDEFGRNLSFAKNEYMSDWAKYIEIIDHILTIYNFTKSQYLEWGQRLVQTPKIKKQLTKISDFGLRDRIVNLCLEYNYDTHITPESKMRIQIMRAKIIERQDLTFLQYENDRETANFWFSVTYPFVPMMDIYLLSRMFKTFDVRNSYHPPIARNIIIYAGKAHISNYVQILKLLGFGEVERFASKNNCLDLSNLKLLFS
jgi:hypothetical protein